MVTNVLTAALTCQGQTPLADMANPSYNNSFLTDDLVSETYTINPSTVAGSIDLPNIANVKVLWITTDQPIIVLVTSSAGVDQAIQLDANGLFAIASTVTSLKFTNNSSTTAARIVLVAAVNRVANPGTPGIY